MAATEQKEVSTKKPEYNSNPFTLSFNALGRFFEKNTPWAIAIIVLGFLGYIGQLGGELANEGSNSQSTTLGTTAATNPDATTTIALVVFIGIFVLVFALVALVVGVFVQGMLTHVAIESEKGNRVSFSDAFNATSKRFWRLLGASLLAFVKIVGWTLLFIIPGIVAAFRYTLLPYVIMDEPEDSRGVKESHDRTKLLVKHRLLEVFGVSTVSAIIPIVGQVLGLAGNAALYRQLQVYNDGNLEKPKKHWLNYLGFILMGLGFLLVAFIAVILAAASLAPTS